MKIDTGDDEEEGLREDSNLKVILLYNGGGSSQRGRRAPQGSQKSRSHTKQNHKLRMHRSEDIHEDKPQLSSNKDAEQNI